jgi:hypothetical protein
MSAIWKEQDHGIWSFLNSLCVEFFWIPWGRILRGVVHFVAVFLFVFDAYFKPRHEGVGS